MSGSKAIQKRFQMFEALRYRDYRFFWFGSLASVLGFQMFLITQGWLIYHLTGSVLQLGLVGLSSAVPSILLNLFGGVIADKVDQRKLIMGTQTLGACVMFVLAGLTMIDVIQGWHIMVSAFLMGGIGAFDMPSRQAIFPHLIDKQALMNAVALNSIIWQGTRILGPAIAGIIISITGATYTFLLTGAGFLMFALLLRSIRTPRLERPSSSGVSKDIVEGLKFIRNNNIFSFLLGMTFFNSFFGLSYVQLMPVFQKDILLVDETGLGLLLAVGGVGSLLGTVTITVLGSRLPKKLLLIGGAMAFGVFLLFFANSHWFLPSLGMVLLIGATSSIYMISAQTILQLLVPDQFRGRVMGFWGITYSLLPLGGFQAGLIASFMGAPFAVSLGGIAVMTFALVGGTRNSQLRQYSR